MNRIYLLIAILIATPYALAGDPAISGHHPLTQIQAGSVLIAELRCSACHTGVEPMSVADKAEPRRRRSHPAPADAYGGQAQADMDEEGALRRRKRS
jgi:hypothetical protein